MHLALVIMHRTKRWEITDMSCHMGTDKVHFKVDHIARTNILYGHIIGDCYYFLLIILRCAIIIMPYIYLRYCTRLWNIFNLESNSLFIISLRSCLPWDICKYLSAFETLNKTAFLEVPFVHFFINTSYQDQTTKCNDNSMAKNLIIHVTS